MEIKEIRTTAELEAALALCYRILGGEESELYGREAWYKRLEDGLQPLFVAKNGENVPVDYTRVRYVKKPSGAKPGMVIYTNQSTVFVTPNQKEAAKRRKRIECAFTAFYPFEANMIVI